MKSPQSKAQRKASRQARNARIAAHRAAIAGEVVEMKPKRAEPRPVHETGLAWLLAKGKITARQSMAGERYGKLYRADIMGGCDSIRSGVEALGMPSGGGDPGKKTGWASATSVETAGWLIDSRAKLLSARASLGFQVNLVAVCDLICGRGLRPREITTVQREAEALEDQLGIALDILIVEFGIGLPKQRAA